MTSRVLALGWMGFVQLVRSRVYLNLLVAGAMLLLAALAFDRLSAGEGGRVLVDVGLAFIALITAALAGITALTTMTREIETKQVHLLVARPIARAEIVLGRFATATGLVVASNLVLGLVLALTMWGLGAAHPAFAFAAAMFASFEALIVASIALLFGVGSSSTMSALFTTTIFLLARLTPALRALLDAGKLDGPLRPALEAIYAALPHLGAFDLTRWVTATDVLDVRGVATSALYGALYCAACLAFASFRLSRRDLL